MVFVRGSERPGGHARELVNPTAAFARKSGIWQLNTSARRFYEREVFHEVGRIPGGSIDDSRKIDVTMVRRINDRENVCLHR